MVLESYKANSYAFRVIWIFTIFLSLSPNIQALTYFAHRKQTDRHTDKETNKQTNRQTDKQTDKKQ